MAQYIEKEFNPMFGSKLSKNIATFSHIANISTTEGVKPIILNKKNLDLLTNFTIIILKKSRI